MSHQDELKGSTFVFAYGSNMFLPRIRARVGPVEKVLVGQVKQRRLVFHKRSVDGSSKADAMRVDSNAESVWGVVYRLQETQKRKLDEFEFLGTGYDQVRVNVIHDDVILGDVILGDVLHVDASQNDALHVDALHVDAQQEKACTSAWMYVARDEAIDRHLLPYSWYRDLILRGALEHQLPPDYIHRLRATNVVEDLDQQRHRENAGLLI